MKIILINESNYQAYTNLDIVAFSYALEGAMGEPGSIYIIDKAGQIYYANYCWDDDCLDRGHIKDIIPVIGDMEFWMLGCETKNENWDSVYLGYGNNLLMTKRIKDGINKKGILKDPDYIYSGKLHLHWPGIVLSIIGKGDPNLTMEKLREMKNNFKRRLLPYQEGEYYGYIDYEGYVVIPFIYQFARFFQEGLAYVKDEDGKWSFIDEEGSMVIPCDQWKGAGDFNEGLAYAVTKDDKWGYIDKTGKCVIPCQWKCADDFSESYAAVQDESEKYGYINRQGEIVIPCQFYDAKPFQNGLAVVKISENEMTFIDAAGKPCPYTWAEVQSFSEGLAPVKNQEGLWGYINENWQIELAYQWSYANQFSEGLAPVMNQEGLWGYINKKGDIIIPYQWYGAREFNDGLAPVDVGPMKWGVINNEGEMVIPARWTFPPSFKDGIAAVFDVINRESGYIDKYGNLISIKKEDLDSFPFDDIDTLDNDCFINEDITSRIYKVGCSWEYIQDPQEIQSKFWDESEEFDKIAYVDLPNGRPTAQVCVLQQGKKYGIYTAYHTIGMGGPGTWCNPMVVSFPYDEVKYFTSIKDGIDEYGLFAFRINEKWGIIKVVDGRNEDMGVYDVEFPLTKRRIVVPCEYFSLADAEFQLRKKIEWKDPFEQETELF